MDAMVAPHTENATPARCDERAAARRSLPLRRFARVASLASACARPRLLSLLLLPPRPLAWAGLRIRFSSSHCIIALARPGDRDCAGSASHSADDHDDSRPADMEADPVKICVLFHSVYGHTHTLAKAVADGARSLRGCSVTLLQVPETLDAAALDTAGARAAKAEFAQVPVATASMLTGVNTLSHT